MQSLRAAAILSVFLLVTIVLIPWQETAVRLKLRRRKTFPQRYHRFLCRLFGIRVTVVGSPVCSSGVLMVANHTSYFDILVLSSAARVSFVAKSEVASWPLFGTLARLQETVFIERAKRSQTVEARDLIRERLAQGDALVLRNAQQIRRAPDQIILKFGHASVGKHDLPHHFDDAGAPASSSERLSPEVKR